MDKHPLLSTPSVHAAQPDIVCGQHGAGDVLSSLLSLSIPEHCFCPGLRRKGETEVKTVFISTLISKMTERVEVHC